MVSSGSALRFEEVRAQAAPPPAHPQPWCGKHVVEPDANEKNVYNYAARKAADKTPMCRVAELARYHKVGGFRELNKLLVFS